MKETNMNIRMFLIALTVFTSSYITGMCEKKKNLFKLSNPYDALGEKSGKAITGTDKISKKVSTWSLLAAATSVLNEKTEKPSNQASSNRISYDKAAIENNIKKQPIHIDKATKLFKNPHQSTATNKSELPAKYVAAHMAKLENSIKIDDSCNEMIIYINAENSKEVEHTYTESIQRWLYKPHEALKALKYVEPTSQKYIGDDIKKKRETIRMHRFSILVDSYMLHGQSFKETDSKTNEQITRIVLNGKVHYEEWNEAKDCYFVYLINANNVCFHRNLVFDLEKYKINRKYIATASYAEEYPSLI